MGTRRLEGPVERDDRVDDAADVHQNGEDEVLGEQRQAGRRRRQQTCHQYLHVLTHMRGPCSRCVLFVCAMCVIFSFDVDLDREKPPHVSVAEWLARLTAG